MIKRGNSKSKNGFINIDYSDGTIIENSNLYKGAKTSFHASGVINSIDSRAYSDSLRELKEQRP